MVKVVVVVGRGVGGQALYHQRGQSHAIVKPTRRRDQYKQPDQCYTAVSHRSGLKPVLPGSLRRYYVQLQSLRLFVPSLTSGKPRNQAWYVLAACKLGLSAASEAVK